MSTLELKKQKLFQFKGAITAVLTSFDKNGELDESQIAGYVGYLVANGVKGVYIIGTTGEGYCLTNDERLRIARTWRQEIDKQSADLITIIHITSNCIKKALELAKEVEKLDFDAIALLPPNYYKPNTIEEFIDYLKLFGKTVPNTPILYYHNVYRTGEFNFEIIEAIGKGLKQIPQLCALKFSDNNVIRLQLLQKNFKNQLKIFIGSDDVLLAGLTVVDVKAGICLLFNLPEVVDSYNKMIKFVEQSDLENARKEQNKITEENIRQRSGNLFLSLKQTVNANVKSLGLDFGLPRPPIHYHYDWQ